MLISNIAQDLLKLEIHDEVNCLGRGPQNAVSKS